MPKSNLVETYPSAPPKPHQLNPEPGDSSPHLARYAPLLEVCEHGGCHSREKELRSTGISHARQKPNVQSERSVGDRLVIQLSISVANHCCPCLSVPGNRTLAMIGQDVMCWLFATAIGDDARGAPLSQIARYFTCGSWKGRMGLFFVS